MVKSIIPLLVQGSTLCAPPSPLVERCDGPGLSWVQTSIDT